MWILDVPSVSPEPKNLEWCALREQKEVCMNGEVVVLRSSGIVAIKSLEWSYDNLCKLLNSDGIEVVRTNYISGLFGNRVRMLVDDCGACKDLPVNQVASALYPGIIYGDVIFLEVDDVGQDFPLSEPEDVFDQLVCYFGHLLEIADI